MNPRPRLSVVVIFFNMEREAERTLYTLSCHYQKNITSCDYEVIAIDNASSKPLSEKFVKQYGDNFRYHYYDTTSKSPSEAINFGVSITEAPTVACIVDGARMLSPNIVHQTLLACKAFNNPFVMSLAWHLGPKEQNQSMLEGYNQNTEDQLLADTDWRENGYRLFDVSTQASSSKVGFFGGLPEELSYFAINKSMFQELGGFCEEFQSPGGGLVNHDFLQRIIENDSLNLVMLLGEGSFHQFHGGIATNSHPENHPWSTFALEYKRIRKRDFELLDQPDGKKITYMGTKPESINRFIDLK
ncbi:hypothetical protein NBRC116583_15410 [Arenicella sp. 4NH20-0111]|uniref:glycosyltransferase n=1 Tax=Arenicella sp. 4NH20-0111 TaxID=3127648 RepID=UPI0031089D62